MANIAISLQPQPPLPHVTSQLEEAPQPSNLTTTIHAPDPTHSMTFILEKIDDLPLRKALSSLQKYTERRQKQSLTTPLLNEIQSPTISLLFSLEKASEMIRSKPLQIELPYSMNTSVSDVCVIVKDPQKKWKEIFAKQSIPEVQKVIGLTKLRKKFNTFQSRRDLCAAFEEFYCDDRIVHRMPTLLGKIFIRSKKLPVGIKIREHDVVTPIRQALKSTWLKIRCGTTAAVRIGRTNMSTEELLENAQTVIKEVVNFYLQKGQWQNNIRGIFLQATNTIALPIYSSIPLELPQNTSPTDKENDTKKKPTKKRVSSKHIAPLKRVKPTE